MANIKHASEHFVEAEFAALKAKVDAAEAGVTKVGDTATIRIKDTNGTVTTATVTDGHDAPMTMVQDGSGNWHSLKARQNAFGHYVLALEQNATSAGDAPVLVGGTQTITGRKTFTLIPVLPNVKTNDISGVGAQYPCGVVIGSTVDPLPNNAFRDSQIIGNGMKTSLSAGNAFTGNGNIAIGNGVMHDNIVTGDLNIGIGGFAMKKMKNGNRNIGIGSLAFFAIEDGYQNVGLGRDVGQCVVNGTRNVAIGYAAMGDNVPIEMDSVIRNQKTLNGNGNTAVGSYAAFCISDNSEAAKGGSDAGKSSYNTFVGIDAGREVKAQTGNTIVGAGCLKNYNVHESYGNYTKIEHNVRNCHWSCIGNRVTITLANHGAVVGKKCVVVFYDGKLREKILVNDEQLLPIVQTTETTFTVEFTNAEGFATEETGEDCGVKWIEGNSVVDEMRCVTAIGYEAGSNAKSRSTDFVLIGAYACCNSKIETSVVVGNMSCFQSTDSTGTFASVPHVSRSALIGYSAARQANGHIDGCSSLGYGALQLKIDGTSHDNPCNCTGIGFNARVSGNNQLQLGNTDTNVYSQSAINIRSDARDKTDVRSTVLGLSFIKKLRPVDFKWDMRDDYVEIVNDGTDECGNEKTKVVRHEKDGSKKRNRFHHGFIAQEVKSISDEIGIDFGGYQDHSVNGGCDVKTLAYEELIAPMVKSIQELAEKNRDLESRIAELEERNA